MGEKLTLLAALTLLGPLALAGEVSPPRRVNFSGKPTATKAGGKVKIAFAVSGKTDVEVAVLDAKGKVVRHLAAGVLGGKKAPPAPLKAGLSQALEWDGRDDFKKPAEGGPFKVRVRAGTGVKFGRFIGECPYVLGRINSIACDEDGNLYVMGSESGGICPGLDVLRVFSPEGKYLRTLVPFPADLEPEAASTFAKWDAKAKCFQPINHRDQLPAFYPWRGGARVTSASKKGGVVLTHGTNVYRMDLKGGNVRGPMPMWPRSAGLKNPHWNIPQLAVSPDGKYIYYSNVAGTQYKPKNFASTDPKWPQGRVYRQDTSKAGSTPRKFYDLVLPDWEKKKYWLPDAWNKRTAAYGICVDAKGHLYVCDMVNQGVVELSPTGKKLSFTKVPWPERVAIDAKTGNYYVISRTRKPLDGYVSKKLLKVVGRGAGAKVVAELPLKGSVGECFALGSVGGKPVMWLAGGGAVVCVRDAGTKLDIVETGFRPDPDAQSGFTRVSADYERDEIYTNNGTNGLWRYDGKTGKGERLKQKGRPFFGVDLSVAYNGLLYVRSGRGYSGPMERYNRDLKPVPFPSGTHILHPNVYSRMGVGFCEKGLGVGPRGESYVSFMYGWNRYFVAGFGPDGKPIKGPYLKGKIPTKSEHGKQASGLDSAVIGPIPATNGGLRVDLAGNIYLGVCALPKGSPKIANSRSTGSIVKFPPSGGTVLGAVKKDDPPEPVGKRTPTDRGLVLVGATAMYPGTSPFSSSGGSCCVCRQPRFDVDRYGRLVFPDAFRNSVTFMDNAGNSILSFGAYGNSDSQYVNPNTKAGKEGKPTVAIPELPMAWPIGSAITVNAVYTIDLYNRRVIRADLTYEAEESCAVPSVEGRTSRAVEKPAPAGKAPEAAGTASSKSSPQKTRGTLEKPSGRTPRQICTGWLSAARNYKKVGMKKDARRCLTNIIKQFPDTKWAAQAGQELKRL